MINAICESQILQLKPLIIRSMTGKNQEISNAILNSNLEYINFLLINIPVTGWISLSPCCANKFGLQYNKLAMLIARQEQIMPLTPSSALCISRTVPI
jgi:hypothetical protein